MYILNFESSDSTTPDRVQLGPKLDTSFVFTLCFCKLPEVFQKIRQSFFIFFQSFFGLHLSHSILISRRNCSPAFSIAQFVSALTWMCSRFSTKVNKLDASTNSQIGYYRMVKLQGESMCKSSKTYHVLTMFRSPTSSKKLSTQFHLTENQKTARESNILCK